MNESLNPPYHWVRKIADELALYDQVPLFGNSPPFNWDFFSSQISAHFGVQPIHLSPRFKGWKKDAREGLGEKPIILAIKVGHLEGSAFWVMSKEAVLQLSSSMMTPQIQSRPLSSDILAEGFYRYLALQVMDAAAHMDPLQQLPLLLEEAPLLETDVFCIDVEIDFNNKSTVWGRLLIEPRLQKSWAEYFSTPMEYLPEKLANATEVNVGVKVGSTVLSQQEWKKMKRGDFLVLDKGSYDPKKQTGAAYLMLGQLPLFQVKIKQNKIQLIDYAFMYEEPMPNNNPPEAVQEEAAILPPAEEEAIALKELPIFVNVELARMRITLEKLMQLAPGNLIELPIHPDQSVKLTVNGQLVGHAELVHLGETLGLRILDLG